MASCVSVIFLIHVYFLVAVTTTSKESGYYVSTEHLNMTYVNPDFFSYFNGTTARPGRWDYKYYTHYHVRSLKTVDNTMKMDIYFYEFLSNEYRRGMVEMHYGFCDLIKKDVIFGPGLRESLPECPIPPGEYHFVNKSIPDLPLLATFPFRKGRIYVTGTAGGVRAAAGYLDMEIKRKPLRRAKPRNATGASLA